MLPVYELRVAGTESKLGNIGAEVFIRMMNYVYRYTQWQRKIPIWNRNHYKHDRNCPVFEVFSPLKCTKIPQNFRLRRAQIPKNVVSGTYEPGTYGNLELAKPGARHPRTRT